MKIIERMTWDTEKGQILDEDRRYVLIRADVLMGIFDGLDTTAREEALCSFQRSVSQNGLDSILSYWEQIQKDAKKLLDSMIAISAELGWGAWSLQDYQPHLIEIEVKNSPFAAASGVQSNPVCYPIVGIMEAMGQLIFDKKVQVIEKYCLAQKKANASCFFIIKPLSNADN